MNYIVYITINLCNGKFYIGVHRTNPEVFDGYIGNGIYRQSDAKQNRPFHKAVKKYGYGNFKRTIIRIFPDNEEGKKAAYKLENILVTDTLLKSKSTYNVALGGEGGIGSEQRTIYLFDLKGNYIRSFKNAKEAAIYINPQNEYNTLKAIRNNCLGISNSSFNYYWSYTKKFNYTKNKKETPVAQYTLDGKYLCNFNSITEAEQALHVNSIEQAIKKHFQCGGFQWRYFNGNTSNIGKLLNTFTKLQILPIDMFDKKGNFIEHFSSVKECVYKYNNLSASQISRVLKNIIKSHKGYVFKYTKQDNDIV